MKRRLALDDGGGDGVRKKARSEGEDRFACTDIMIPLVRLCILSHEGQEKVLWAWRRVSKAAYDSVVYVVREVLVPRMRALEVALRGWLDAPSETPFPFPVPRGPLPVLAMPLCKGVGRRGARPRDASPIESCWWRPFYAWAISFVLYANERQVDVQLAVDKAIPLYSDSHALFTYAKGIEPVLDFFAGVLDYEPRVPHPFNDTWSQRPASVSPQALLSTLCVKSVWQLDPYNWNQHFFACTLLDQFRDCASAIAFVLCWMQHVAFEGYMPDVHFQLVLIPLVRHLIHEWRGSWPDLDCFFLWFGSHPETLVYETDYVKQYGEMTEEARQKFNDETCQSLVLEATGRYLWRINNALDGIRKRREREREREE